MVETPLVSIITNVRNGAATIEKAFESVANQTYKNIEYIVIDGASTDGTVDLIKKHESIISYWESKEDESGFEAANEGFAKATGEIVGLLCSDDWLSDDSVENIVNAYLENPSSKVISFGLQDYKIENENVIPQNYYSEPQKDNFDLETSIYCHGATHYYHKSIFEEFGDFDYKSYPLIADREFHMRIGLANVKKAQTNDVVYNFLCHEGSRTTNGSDEVIITSLEEHLLIFEDYINNKDLNQDQANVLNKWFGFTVVRLGYYYTKTGAFDKAVRLFFRSVKERPKDFIAAFFDHSMPKEFKPVKQTK